MFENDPQQVEESTQLGEPSPLNYSDSRGAAEAPAASHALAELAATFASPFSRSSPWVRAAELPGLFCSWDLAYRCTRSGWLKPIIRGKRRTIYRLADVLTCLRRIESGELPSARPSRNER